MLCNMGRISKLQLHELPLVSLCKERKEIIKATNYSWYDFVTSFEVYLNSLLELGNALNQYVEQEFLIYDYDHSYDHFEEEEEPISSHHHSPEVKNESRYTCKHNMKNKGYEIPYYDDHDDEEDEESISSYHHCIEMKNKSRYTCKHHGRDRNNMKNSSKSYVVLYDHDDQDERKIREREEIPALEDKSDQSSNVGGLNSNEEVMVGREITEENINGNLKPKETIQQKDIKSLGNSMNLKEAVLDIKNEFKHLFDCGREFLSIFEADKLSYHSVNSKSKGMISGLSVVTSSGPIYKKKLQIYVH